MFHYLLNLHFSWWKFPFWVVIWNTLLGFYITENDNIFHQNLENVLTCTKSWSALCNKFWNSWEKLSEKRIFCYLKTRIKIIRKSLPNLKADFYGSIPLTLSTTVSLRIQRFNRFQSEFANYSIHDSDVSYEFIKKTFLIFFISVRKKFDSGIEIYLFSIYMLYVSIKLLNHEKLKFIVPISVDKT